MSVAKHFDAIPMPCLCLTEYFGPLYVFQATISIMTVGENENICCLRFCRVINIADNFSFDTISFVNKKGNNLFGSNIQKIVKKLHNNGGNSSQILALVSDLLCEPYEYLARLCNNCLNSGGSGGGKGGKGKGKNAQKPPKLPRGSSKRKRHATLEIGGASAVGDAQITELIEIICARSNDELAELNTWYKKHYGSALADEIDGKIRGNSVIKLILTRLLDCQRPMEELELEIRKI